MRIYFSGGNAPPCIIFSDSASNCAAVVDPSSGAASSVVTEHLRKRGITHIEEILFSRNSVSVARGLHRLLINYPVKSIVLPEKQKYERIKSFYNYLEKAGADEKILCKTSEKIKIMRQKDVVRLEYFKRCAKLKIVLFLKKTSSGWQIGCENSGKECFSLDLIRDGKERIYCYEFRK